MKAVLPGRPEARLQALSTGYWDGRRIIVYITGNALAILSGPETVLQSIYDDDERALDAVAFDESSGKIAAVTESTVRIYRPIDAVGGEALSWALQATFEFEDEDDEDEDNKEDRDHDKPSKTVTAATLSWGSSSELLVGRAALRLYNTASTPPSCHWYQRLPSPAKSALLSPDSSYIASVGYHDRLVKVWRRLNFGFEEVHFELGYLPHPRAVVSIQWRRPFHVDQSVPENILYSFCADGLARIWTGADGHTSCQNLRLWGKLDLVRAIGRVPSHKKDHTDERDRRHDSNEELRWAFIISQRDLANATERAVQETGGQQSEDVALQYLLSIANRDTEICVVFDARGTMSAWALENVSAKTTAANNIDNVAFVRSKDFDFLRPRGAGARTTETSPPHVEILSYCNKAAGHLHLLIHRFDGKVDLFESSIADLFDPTAKGGGRRLTPRASWSGHSASIKKIVRNFSGHAIVSRTQQERGECIVWKQGRPGAEEELLAPKLIPERRHIHRIALIRGGSFVVFLHHDSVAVWDCRGSVPALIAEQTYDLPGKPLCVLVLPRLNKDDVAVAHIATITSERRGVVWEVHLPLCSPHQTSANTPAATPAPTAANNDPFNHHGHHQHYNLVNGHSDTVIQEFCTFTLDDVPEDLAYVLPVDPAGSSQAVSSGFLDIFTRDIAVSYTRSGRIDFWTARINPGGAAGEPRGVEWLSTAHVDTGIGEPSLVSGSTMKKAALVNRDRSAVSIWDVRGARLEWYAQDGVEQDREPFDLEPDPELEPDVEGAGVQDPSPAVTPTTTMIFNATSTTKTTAPVQDLDWTSTPDKQSILAVGYPYRIVLLSELRFDYLNRGPAWAPLREINVRELTPHPIGDSAWLSGGNLVVGAGNQFFVYGRRFAAPTDRRWLWGADAGRARSGARLLSSQAAHPRKTTHRRHGGGARGSDGAAAAERDMFEVVQRLNGPLPIFHPQFLSQCILAAKNDAVKRVLLALHRVLKYHVEGDVIDNYLGLDLAEFYAGSDAKTPTRRTNGAPKSFDYDTADYGGGDGYDDEHVFTEEVAARVCEKLQRVALPQLSAHEQMQLVDIAECVGTVEKQRRSLDENGARFMLFFRQRSLLLRRRRRHGGSSRALSHAGAAISWREINWAFHSGSQDILADFVARQFHGAGLLWENARESGIFMWLADANAVKAQFEVVARNEYTKNELKNPVDCSLFYLALRKKAVLQGLWRMAAWNREQAATQRLLANNFDDPRWRTTALKNAYALMSKRRFQYAAAFFLLADHLQDAVNVCLNQIRDLQLAVAVARVYGGDQSPVFRRLLEDEILPLAAREGNRWLASWAFWMLGRRDMAVRALINPVYTLLEPRQPPDPKAKLFLTDDPALVVLYAQLRDKTLQTLRGAARIAPRDEWQFVLHNARLYDRMGCDLLGLDLVRNWEFLLQPATLPTFSDDDGDDIDLDVHNLHIDPRKMLRRGSTLVVADLPVPSSPSASGAAPDVMRTGTGPGAAAVDPNQPKAKPQPTVFEEPDANSLLDSFGF